MLHLGLLGWIYTAHAQSPPAPEMALLGRALSPGEGNTKVGLVFGPPSIRARDGTTFTEPPTVRLEAARAVYLPKGCTAFPRAGRAPLSGRVELRVKRSGRVDVVKLARSTGDRCGDDVIAVVAGDLRYGWLPDERFPAPVDLVQPVPVTDPEK